MCCRRCTHWVLGLCRRVCCVHERYSGEKCDFVPPGRRRQRARAPVERTVAQQFCFSRSSRELASMWVARAGAVHHAYGRCRRRLRREATSFWLGISGSLQQRQVIRGTKICSFGPSSTSMGQTWCSCSGLTTQRSLCDSAVHVLYMRCCTCAIHAVTEPTRPHKAGSYLMPGLPAAIHGSRAGGDAAGLTCVTSILQFTS